VTKLTALCYFLLSLFGLDVGDARYVHQTSADGADVLYSRADVHAGVARFECVRSASGRCHYLVFAAGCDPSAGCRERPLQRFSVDAGGSRQLAGLAGFHLCVAARAADLGPACAAPAALASR
jgi:hypothetical protein